MFIVSFHIFQKLYQVVDDDEGTKEEKIYSMKSR